MNRTEALALMVLKTFQWMVSSPVKVGMITLLTRGLQGVR